MVTVVTIGEWEGRVGAPANLWRRFSSAALRCWPAAGGWPAAPSWWLRWRQRRGSCGVTGVGLGGGWRGGGG